MGVTFDVKPQLVIRPDNSVSGTVRVSTSKWGNEFSATVSDEMVKDGLSTNGLQLGLKASQMEVEYRVDSHRPKLIFHSGLTIRDKQVGLKYTHEVRGKGTALEATVAVDDDNKAVLTYDLSNYEGPDYRHLILKWVHTQKDFVIEPQFNLATESLSAAVTYKVDDDNKLKAIYDTKSNVGKLEWTNTGSLGGDGTLRITARSALDADSVKKMPTLMVEKTWSLEV